MRILYSLAWLFLLPVAFLYLLWRARRQPEYLRHWDERLGAAPITPAGQPLIWIHAVSVGETRACEPLARALLARHPQCRLLLTHATPTGRATGADLFGNLISQAYLPYDLPPLVERFLKRSRPDLGIIMETELWPNLFAACQARGLPLYLVNARLSERSARGYARFRRLLAPALASLRGIAAQSPADAARLGRLGAGRINITGNMKFDAPLPADTAAQAEALARLFDARFVWLAASTRQGEERLILKAWQRLDRPDLLLVIVPRHPQRFDEVAAMMRTLDPHMVRRSEARPLKPETRLFLGDSMGEMAAYYATCRIALIGGSLEPLGGQNPIEAAAAGCPILLGPHTWNFQDIAQELVQAGAALRVETGATLGVDGVSPDQESVSREGAAQVLADAVARLMQDPEALHARGQRAREYVEARRGSTERVLDMLRPELESLQAGTLKKLALD